VATKPETTSTGVLVIPKSTFYAWAQGFLPQGPFYTMGKMKEKGEDIEVPYNSSTAAEPPSPPVVEI
jgi:hypothetical protein